MRTPQNKWLALREPLQPPAIDPRLEELNPVVRSTECLRHFVLSTEYWLSPDGRLRWWIKLNVCLATFTLIPAVILMPIISLVLHEVDEWLFLLLSIAWKLILLSTLISVVVFVLKHRHKHFPSSSPRSSGRRK